MKLLLQIIIDMAERIATRAIVISIVIVAVYVGALDQDILENFIALLIGPKA